LEPVPGRHPEVHPGKVTYRGDHNLRRKRERGKNDPRGDGAVVGTKRGAARNVVEELALNAVHRALAPARSVAGRETPAVRAVTREVHRIADGVLLLDEGRLPAVLEVVAAAVPHELVADAAKIYPHVGKLVREERARVEQLSIVDGLPLVS